MNKENAGNIVLQIKDLSYMHPKTKQRIFSGINLDIYKNQITAIVGKVGSGKSTLLKHLNGIITPQMGEVIIKGKSVIEHKDFAFHQQVGLLFENPDDQLFYPIVVDDIAFGPRNLKLSKEEIHNRVLDASNKIGVTHLLERETSTLSFGEKTLVAIAGLLAMKSDIILLDTPEVGLDLWTRPSIMKLILELKQDQTIVIATNDIDIMRTADRILLLWDGKIRGEYDNLADFKRQLS